MSFALDCEAEHIHKTLKNDIDNGDLWFQKHGSLLNRVSLGDDQERDCTNLRTIGKGL